MKRFLFYLFMLRFFCLNMTTELDRGIYDAKAFFLGGGVKIRSPDHAENMDPTLHSMQTIIFLLRVKSDPGPEEKNSGSVPIGKTIQVINF